MPDAKPEVEIRCRKLGAWPLIVRQADRELGQGWDTSLAKLRGELRTELQALGVVDCIVETDHPPEAYSRLDGWPMASATAKSPRVAVWFELNGRPTVLRCDGHGTWGRNLRAICMTLRQNRMLRRYGTSTIDEQYGGYAALPSGAGASDAPAATPKSGFADKRAAALYVWECARPGQEAPNNTIDAIVRSGNTRRQYHREAARRVHPDMAGGDHGAMSRLSEAMALLSRD